jgi:hypothetical protein
VDRIPFSFSQPGTLSTVLCNSGFQNVDKSPKHALDLAGKAASRWELVWPVTTPSLPFLGRILAEKRSEIDAKVLAAIGKYVDS